MKIKSIKWDRLLIAAGLLQGIDVIMGWFSVSFRIVSAIIALIALFFLVIYFLRRKKVILLHDEISRYIIDEINSIREQCKANNGGSELTDSWLPKYSQLLESLSDVFRTSILDRMLNSNLMELIEKSVVWTPEDGNDGCSESLKSAFDDLICIFAGNKTLSIVRSWKVSGRCKSAPDRGIDADIDPRIIDKIAERMIERFRLWIALTNNKGKIISVLLIGANNQKLTQLVLEGMRDTPECEGLNLFIRGTANDNEEFIKNLFGKDDSGDNRDKVRIQTTEIEFYDVAIVTHYYQHHDFNHYLFVKMPVVEGGLLLWLSAISRARDFDEYVCEGCMPKRANILNNYMRGGIPFASMKQFGKKQYIFYTPFREFASNSGSISLLAMGFPKKFIVDAALFKKDMGKVIEEYLKWELINGLGGLFQKTEQYKMMSKPSPPTIKHIECLLTKKETNGSREYSIVSLKYSVGKTISKMNFIVTTGSEFNEWNGKNLSSDYCLITLNPALHFDCSKVLTDNHERVGELLNKTISVLENGKADRIDRYIASINSEMIKVCDNEGVVCELKTDIRDVDLNQILFFFTNCKENRGNARCYYSFLPKRRYLTPREFGAEYQFMEDFKKFVDNLDLDEKAKFLPVLSHSVTWLRSFSSLKDFLSKEGFVVEDGTDGQPDGCFFHKCLGEISDAELNEIVYTDDFMLSEKNGELLRTKKHSVEKDVIFNTLPMNVRLKLIPNMNVHDVLITAIKKSETQQSKWKSILNRI